MVGRGRRDGADWEVRAALPSPLQSPPLLTPPSCPTGRSCATAQTVSRCAHSAQIAPSGCCPAPVPRPRYEERWAGVRASGAGRVRMAAAPSRFWPTLCLCQFLPSLSLQLCHLMKVSPFHASLASGGHPPSLVLPGCGCFAPMSASVFTRPFSPVSLYLFPISSEDWHRFMWSPYPGISSEDSHPHYISKGLYSK